MAAPEKSASSISLKFVIIAVILVLAALAAVVIRMVASSGYAVKDAVIGNKHYSLEVADTPAKQQLGLGRRDNLANDAGMLFPYDHSQQLCFWMKDMHFPIDIIWLDSNKKIVKVEPFLQPSSYPRTFCAQSSQYVIELNAGSSDQAQLKLGQQVEIE